MISLALNTSKDDKILLNTSKTLYSSSVFEMLQLCEIDEDGQFQLLNLCDRYNLARQEPLMFSRGQLQSMLKSLNKDSHTLELSISEARKRSWFYYWRIDFKNLIFIFSRSTK